MSVGTARDRFVAFWFGPGSAESLAAVRIVFSIAALANWSTLWGLRRELLGTDGLVPAGLAAGFTPPASLLALVEGDGGVDAILGVGLVAILALAMGWFTRFSAVVTYLVLASATARLSWATSGWDFLQCSIAFVLVFAPCGHRWSVDSRKRASPGTATVPRYALRLLQWQFAIMMWTTVWLKLGDPIWRDGVAVGHFLIGAFTNFETTAVLRHPTLNLVLTHGTVVLELASPILLWHPRTRWLGFIALAPLLAVLITSKVWVFGLTTLALALAFLELGPEHHPGESVNG